MRRFFTWEYLAVFIPALALAVAAVWFTLRYVKPAPPDTFVLAAASKGSPYYDLALRFKEEAEKKGVKLEVRESEGSLDNLRLLKDETSDVQAGIAQGGLTNHIDSPSLYSMGRLIIEPVWVFYRGDAPLSSITELKGKRILIGPEGSGTAALAKRLLGANGITAENSTLIAMQLPDYVETFAQGGADAGFLVLGPEAKTVQRLLHQDGTRLMSMAQADALIQRYPYLTQVTMRRGVVDFAQNIPPADTVLVATKAMLLIRDDLHPALLAILAQAVLKVQSQPTLKPTGESKIFALGTESLVEDPEFPMIDDATRVYKSGPTFFQRVLPFWLATLIDRAAILILPMIGVVIPLARIAPLLYNWRMRQRILHWYRELKRIEQNLTYKKASAEFVDQKERDLDRVEEAVWRLSVPTHLSADLYTLRDHVEFVRRRIQSLRDVTTVTGASTTPEIARDPARADEPALEAGV
ncbi:ABC transporter substrate-binding protein [Rhodomicrobium sp. Az07]|uniref:TAXI family TRAP transporter solute-binding subunit n=1 Tax=Rhodomicrobium sp. Az07 TaxID=2839034 RepID=UPI001BEB87FB|nr:TAXI family TRAP transporter solute-binding subunit [Rhodomicrobium sp. Az07]MBT3070198.1 ABC transporter substrate-binding protein [Rhodomicrobium sp. Az07]